MYSLLEEIAYKKNNEMKPLLALSS